MARQNARSLTTAREAAPAQAEREVEDTSETAADNWQWPRWEEIPWHAELSGEGVITVGHPDSPKRNEPRRMIRVVVSSQNGTSICGQRAENGVNFLLVYASDVDRILRMLPTQRQRQLLDVATQQYEAAFEVFVQECGGNVVRANAERGFTPWTFYDQLTKNMKGLSGGYPIVRDVAVWEGEVPPPETQESISDRATEKAISANRELAREIAKAMAERR